MILSSIASLIVIVVFFSLYFYGIKQEKLILVSDYIKSTRLQEERNKS